MVAAMSLSIEAIPRTMGGIGRGQDQAAKSAGVSKQRLSHAMLVREHAPNLVADVIGGTRTLDAAYAIAGHALSARRVELAMRNP